MIRHLWVALGPSRTWPQQLIAVLLIGCLALPGCTQPTTKKKAAAVPSISTGTFATCPTTHGTKPDSDALPDVSLGCLDGSGTRYPLAQPTGKPMVITVWASWCPPCGEELPAFEELTKASSELTVLGVVTEDTLSAALQLAAEAKVSFPNVFDPTGEVRRTLGRNALPITVFVTAKGAIAHVYNGPALTSNVLRSLVGQHLGVTVK